jgi:protein required for attachment to host cells
MKPKTTWILIADTATAHVVASSGKADELTEVEDIRLQGDASPSRELAADRPGRAFDRAGDGRHGMEPPTDPHRVEQERFVREIAAVLGEAAQRQRFDRLVLVAPPRFMGLLRDALPPGVASKVGAELTKGLTRLSIHELPDHLAPVLS